MIEKQYISRNDILNIFDEVMNTFKSQPVNIESPYDEVKMTQAIATLDDCRNLVLGLPVYVVEIEEECENCQEFDCWGCPVNMKSRN